MTEMKRQTALTGITLQFFEGLVRGVGGKIVGIQYDGRPEADPLVLVRSLACGTTVCVPFKQFNTLQVALALSTAYFRFNKGQPNLATDYSRPF